MARTPTTEQQALLDKLEPEAAALFATDDLTLAQTVGASAAITARRQASADESRAQSEADAREIDLVQMDSTTRDTLPAGLRGRYEVTGGGDLP